MFHVYTSQSYISASAKLDEICAWLEHLGIRYSATRVGRYKQLFASLARHQLADSLLDFYKEYDFASFVNAVHEVAEIVRIYEGLSTSADDKLLPRLQSAMRGHEFYVLDNEDRSGRDFTLELSVAAKFTRAGLEVDFGHDADVHAKYGNFTFFVECKRLKSKKNAPQRIKSGLNQLCARFSSSENPTMARGLLVLSIAKIMNVDLGLLTADTPKLLGDKVFAYNRSFIETHRRHWQPPRDDRTLGVAIIFDAPGIVGKKNMLVTCHETTINNSVPVHLPDYKLLLQITSDVFPKHI